MPELGGAFVRAKVHCTLKKTYAGRVFGLVGGEQQRELPELPDAPCLRDSGLGISVEGFGFRLGLKSQGLGFRVYELGFRDKHETSAIAWMKSCVRGSWYLHTTSARYLKRSGWASHVWVADVTVGDWML